MDKLMSSFSATDEKFVADMNGLSSEEQRQLLLQKAQEFLWGFYENKVDKKDRNKRNFHIIVNNEDLRIQREERRDFLRRKIIKWTLWNKTHRIEGTYGELIYQLIKLINKGNEGGEE